MFFSLVQQENIIFPLLLTEMFWVSQASISKHFEIVCGHIYIHVSTHAPTRGFSLSLILDTKFHRQFDKVGEVTH